MLKFTDYISINSYDVARISFNSYLQELEKKGKLTCFYCFIPEYDDKSGVSSNYETKWSRMGKKFGLPNYLFMNDQNACFILFLNKTTSISPAQLKVKREVEASGVKIHVCFTIGEAVEKLKENKLINE